MRTVRTVHTHVMLTPVLPNPCEELYQKRNRSWYNFCELFQVDAADHKMKTSVFTQYAYSCRGDPGCGACLTSTPVRNARTPGPTHVKTRASTNARTHHVRARTNTRFKRKAYCVRK